MYAIVDIAGQQVKVEKGLEVYVHRLEGEEGSKIAFDKVMLIDNNGKVNIGDPVVDGAQVKATIIEHLKGDKVLVFKKKRRKGYKKLNGHRQYLSLVKIEDIIASGAKKATPKAEAKPEAKKETPKVAKPKAEVKKETVKKEAKKAAPKKEVVAEVKKAAPKPKKESPKAEKKPAEEKKAPETTDNKE